MNILFESILGICIVISGIFVVSFFAIAQQSDAGIESLPPGTTVRAFAIYDQAFPDMNSPSSNIFIIVKTYYVPTTTVVGNQAIDKIDVGSVWVNVDMTNITKLNPSIVEGIKNDGTQRGYIVERVFLPDYRAYNPIP